MEIKASDKMNSLVLAALLYLAVPAALFALSRLASITLIPHFVGRFKSL